MTDVREIGNLICIDRGALQLAINVLDRAGKHEVMDAIKNSAVDLPDMVESQRAALAAKDAEIESLRFNLKHVSEQCEHNDAERWNAVEKCEQQAAEIERLKEQVKYNHLRMDQMLCEIDHKEQEIERLQQCTEIDAGFINEYKKQIEQLQARVKELEDAFVYGNATLTHLNLVGLINQPGG